MTAWTRVAFVLALAMVTAAAGFAQNHQTRTTTRSQLAPCHILVPGGLSRVDALRRCAKAGCLFKTLKRVERLRKDEVDRAGAAGEGPMIRFVDEGAE